MEVQIEEVETIKAIYPDCFNYEISNDNGQIYGFLSVTPRFDGKATLQYDDDDNNALAILATDTQEKLSLYSSENTKHINISSSNVSSSGNRQQENFQQSSSSSKETKTNMTPSIPSKQQTASSSSSQRAKKYFQVSFLPPVNIQFHMNNTYPQENCFDFGVDCFWLGPSLRKHLKSHLESFWETDHDSVLYRFITFIEEEMLSSLGFVDMNSNGNSHRILIDINSLFPSATTYELQLTFHPEKQGSEKLLTSSLQVSASSSFYLAEKKHSSNNNKSIMKMNSAEIEHLIQSMKMFNQYKKSQVFQVQTFYCQICLENKKGKDCFELGQCEHVFCFACLRDYYTNLIQEGNVRMVKCPDPSCKKEKNKSEKKDHHEDDNLQHELNMQQEEQEKIEDGEENNISDGDLEKILSSYMYKRYKELRTKQHVETRQDITFCPRSACKQPVKKDPNEEKLCVCKVCSFAFCFYCLRSWHGNASPCQLSNFEKMMNEYNMAQSDEEKKILGIMYGKKVVEKIERELEWDREFNEWKRNNTQICPTCRAAIEKNEGCNHMLCYLCDTHFCYLCGACLSQYQPYTHYTNPRSSCFEKLFEVPDEEDGFF